jgi:hypothetical protein
MPYAILSGALPAKKMGLYMGIFNLFIVLPQMLAATILGLLVIKLFWWPDRPCFSSWWGDLNRRCDFNSICRRFG